MDVDEEDDEQEEERTEDAHKGHGKFMQCLCWMVFVLTAYVESSDSSDEGNTVYSILIFALGLSILADAHSQCHYNP